MVPKQWNYVGVDCELKICCKSWKKIGSVKYVCTNSIKVLKWQIRSLGLYLGSIKVLNS